MLPGLRIALLLLGLLAVADADPAFAQGSGEASRSNLPLFTADDMNWDSVGVYGSPMENPTPHLDELAREGMHFKRAHVNVAVCAPSRSIMTGLYSAA